MKPEEHYSEAKRLADQAERVSRTPNQPFDPTLWLKVQTHALLAIAGEVVTVRELLTPPPPPVQRHVFETRLPGEEGE